MEPDSPSASLLGACAFVCGFHNSQAFFVRQLMSMADKCKFAWERSFEVEVDGHHVEVYMAPNVEEAFVDGLDVNGEPKAQALRKRFRNMTFLGIAITILGLLVSVLMTVVFTALLGPVVVGFVGALSTGLTLTLLGGGYWWRWSHVAHDALPFRGEGLRDEQEEEGCDGSHGDDSLAPFPPRVLPPAPVYDASDAPPPKDL
eukprot:TRINITY_DN9970_c0_g1_i2.p1 TRINITY_DN9970_c0_g1~~TRINITY_DN9970_c0_g1_i2.p1  ORF type:complete len:202 (+),score=27.71 TRINITY_DN9970_c0_g1_i2:81-686(+)